MATIGKTASRTKAGAPTVQKRVALVASEKGGVGKSVFTRTLVDSLRSTGHRVAAYDSDGAIGATLRVLGERGDDGALLPVQNAITGVGFYNGRAEGERNQLLDSIETGEGLYIHDLAGGLLADLTRIVDGGKGLGGLLDAFTAHGYRVTVFHIICPDVGATQSVARWLDLTGDRADHVAVVNLKLGQPLPVDFPFWFGFDDAAGVHKGGKTRERLLLGGGVEITFPALPSGTFAKVDSENVPLSNAANIRLLTITERAHVTKFLNDFRSALAPALPFLGLAE